MKIRSAFAHSAERPAASNCCRKAWKRFGATGGSRKSRESAKALPRISNSGSLPVKCRTSRSCRSKCRGGLLEITRVPGVGPKTAQLLHKELGISSLDELEQACKAQRIRTVKGLGPKTEANILRGIDRLRRHSERVPLGVALPVGRHIVEALEAVPEVQRAALTGSLRRGRDTIGDIDVIASSAHPRP